MDIRQLKLEDLEGVVVDEAVVQLVLQEQEHKDIMVEILRVRVQVEVVAWEVLEKLLQILLTLEVLEELEFYTMEPTMVAVVAALPITEQELALLARVVWEVVEQVDKMDSLS
jgi:hypothetical protein